ncbi:MAG: ATP-binding protein [Candidatus Firestonebacteria bacterium]
MKTNCWETKNCGKKECPAYGSTDGKCWLRSGTYCLDQISGKCVEKMEACLDCVVFKENYDPKDCLQTLELMSEQFKSVTGKLRHEQESLKTAQKKLLEFKTTSVYLLKELDKKNREVLEEVRNRTAELKEAEERLSQAAKVAALSRFSAGIAHEINNPLGAVINYARTVLADPELKLESRNYLEQSLKGLFRIDNVVKQILSYSGKKKLEEVGVNKVLTELMEFHQFKLREKKIQLKMLLDERNPKTYADAAQLHQVFANIMKNAVDSMEGTEKKELTVATVSDNERITVTFLDSGTGIKEENKDKLFTPFFTTKEVGEGTGLGLFISYNIIQVLRGELELAPIKEGGTRVTVTLPAYSGE